MQLFGYTVKRDSDPATLEKQVDAVLEQITNVRTFAQDETAALTLAVVEAGKKMKAIETAVARLPGGAR